VSTVSNGRVDSCQTRLGNVLIRLWRRVTAAAAAAAVAVRAGAGGRKSHFFILVVFGRWVMVLRHAL